MSGVTTRPMLSIGALRVPASTAKKIVTEYTMPPNLDHPSRRDFFSWPYYDGFQSGTTVYELCDGDLLAPALLNADPGIHGFAGLQQIRWRLEQRLADVPSNVDLADATDDDIDSVTRLFGVIDEHPVFGVRGTILSKVLHRKRPRLIPLHDRYINAAYVPDPIPAAHRRTWDAYAGLLMRAMRDDLRRSSKVWEPLEQIPRPSEVVLTRLRVLDIIAWHQGKR